MFSFISILAKFVALILGLEDGQCFPPPLSAERERELFKLKENGNDAARDELIEHNLRLVSHIIKKYYSNYSEPDEILSIGSLGLIKAVDSFKSEFGTKFATYGAKCIQNEILMFFRSKKKDLPEVSINETIDIDKDGNPLTYLDVISVDENIAEELDSEGYYKRVRELVDTILDSREAKIIVLRYGLKGYKPRTQREVAEYLKISRSYVSRIEKKAFEKLKDAFGINPPEFSD